MCGQPSPIHVLGGGTKRQRGQWPGCEEAWVAADLKRAVLQDRVTIGEELDLIRQKLRVRG